MGKSYEIRYFIIKEGNSVSTGIIKEDSGGEERTGFWNIAKTLRERWGGNFM